MSVHDISGYGFRCPGCKDRSSSSSPEERSNGGSCHGGNVDGREAGHDEGGLNVTSLKQTMKQTNKRQCFSADELDIWQGK